MKTLALVLLMGLASAAYADRGHYGGHNGGHHHGHHHRGSDFSFGIYIGPSYDSGNYYRDESPYYYDRYGRVIVVDPYTNYYYEFDN